MAEPIDDWEYENDWEGESPAAAPASSGVATPGAAPARSHPDNWMGDVAQFMDESVAADPSTTTGAFRRGTGQGLSLGFGDELAGISGAAGHMLGTDLRRVRDEGWGSVADSLMAPKERFNEWLEAYKRNRDDIRRTNAQAQEEHPVSYGAGQVAGSMPLAVTGTGLAGTLAVGAGTGAVRGLGESEAADASGLIRDTGAGTVTGLAGGGVGYGAGKLVGAVARPAANRLLQGEVNAAQEIAEQASQRAASDMGRVMQPLSREAAEAGRHIENILEHMATLDPQGRAMFMRTLPPNVRAEVGRTIQEQVDKAAQYLGNRVRPTMETPRSAASFAEELASPAAGARQAGKEVWGAVRSDVKQIPGARTAMAVGKAAKNVFTAPGAKYNIYQQMRYSLQVNPERWGRFGSALANAAESGEQSFAATDYLLSQSDPEYRALKRDFETESTNE